MTNNNYLYIIVILLYIIIYNNITLYVNPIPYILIVKLLIVNVRFARCTTLEKVEWFLL